VEPRNGVSVPAPAGGLRDKRKVLLVLAVFVVFGLIAGGVYGWTHRGESVCPDGKPPVQQLDQGLGQVKFRCHDGQIVSQ
jgi:hypothetical protein